MWGFSLPICSWGLPTYLLCLSLQPRQMAPSQYYRSFVSNQRLGPIVRGMFSTAPITSPPQAFTETNPCYTHLCAHTISPSVTFTRQPRLIRSTSTILLNFGWILYNGCGEKNDRVSDKLRIILKTLPYYTHEYFETTKIKLRQSQRPILSPAALITWLSVSGSQSLSP